MDFFLDNNMTCGGKNHLRIDNLYTVVNRMVQEDESLKQALGDLRELMLFEDEESPDFDFSTEGFLAVTVKNLDVEGFKVYAYINMEGVRRRNYSKQPPRRFDQVYFLENNLTTEVELFSIIRGEGVTYVFTDNVAVSLEYYMNYHELVTFEEALLRLLHDSVIPVGVEPRISLEVKAMVAEMDKVFLGALQI